MPPPPPPRLLRPGLEVPGRGEVGVSSAAGRYGGGRLTPPQEKRRPSKSAQLTERKRHWKAGEFPAGSATGRDGGRAAPPQEKRHWKAGEFPAGAAAGRDGGRPGPPQEKRHWKAGEFPGTAAPPDSKASRTPLKNVKKRLDARADAKAWACTVTEALADCINSKSWQEALQVKHHHVRL